MTTRRLRWLALVALSGGTVFQAASCESVLGPAVASLASTLVSVALQSVLLGT